MSLEARNSKLSVGLKLNMTYSSTQIEAAGEGE